MRNESKWYKGSHNPIEAYNVWKYNQEFRKEHPEYFDPDGILVFCGGQGAGKTISMVQYLFQLFDLYPSVVVCANIKLNLPERYSDIKVVPWTGVESFTDVSNGYAGVVYVLDEIHLLFNSLESKKMDVTIFETISQQRKQRKHIIGTAQVFGRLAKPFREQFKYVVACNCIMHCFQINTLLDAKHTTITDAGEVIASNAKKYCWFHTPELYESYDTYEVVKRMRKDWEVEKC